MSNSMYRPFLRGHHATLAILAGLGALAGGAQLPGASAGVDLVRAGGTYAEPGAPLVSLRAGSSSQAARTDFFRGRSSRRTFKGVSMSVAEGKRRARKRRNVLRHKKHWKQARR